MNRLQQKDSYNVFFVNDDHERNYQTCIQKFQCKNPEYSSTCYLAALPDIFKCFTLHLQVHGPFDWYFDHLYDTADSQNPTFDQPKGTISALTGQITVLVRLALNLWNGHEFDLTEGLSIWDSDLYKVALQAIDLRRRMP